MKNTPNPSRDGMMLGIGLDNKDGHKRITKGDNFYLIGGTEETHDHMTETAIRINETLERKGKRLCELSPQEFSDIFQEASEN